MSAKTTLTDDEDDETDETDDGMGRGITKEIRKQLCERRKVKEDEQRKGTPRTMKKEETNVAIFEHERDDENDENDEDEEELEFMKSYREKRIAEMLFMQKEEKEDEKEEKNNNFIWNEYINVSHEQWTKEVTEVSRSHPVLVLLTKENSKACYARESDGRCGAYVSNVADEVSSGGGEGYHSELSGEERADTYFVQERGRG